MEDEPEPRLNSMSPSGFFSEAFPQFFSVYTRYTLKNRSHNLCSTRSRLRATYVDRRETQWRW
jgi:hypothetical protein